MATEPENHVVLVHGAWHQPACWDETRAAMSEVTSSAVALPSSGPVPAQLGDLHADAAAVRAHIAEVRTGAPNARITVVAHSYGGLPVTQGLAGDAEPLADQLVFLAAFVLDVGQSLLDTVGGTPPDWWDVHEDEDYIDATDPGSIFYVDCDAAVTARAIGELQHQSFSAVRQPLTETSWRQLPSSYIVCDADAGIPPAAQEAMAAPLQRTLHLDSAHCPMFSRPRELAAMLTELATV